MKRITFIIHGKAKEKDLLSEKIRGLFHENEVQIKITQHQNHASEIACEAVKSGSEIIVCGGGDGSLNETANGVMQGLDFLKEEEKEKIRLAVLPLGTGNDFIKTMRSPSNIKILYEAIQKDNVQKIDLGFAEFFSQNGKPQKRYFINIVDVGMGGVVAEKLSRYSKWLGANLTYQRAILSTLITYKNQAIEVNSNTFSYKGNMMNFIVANGKYFGSGLGIAPEASPLNGKFSVVILGGISILDYLRNLGKVKRCEKIKHPQVQYHRAETIELNSALPLPIDMDGEFVGYSPLKISIHKQALKFIV
ncbi:MAG: diacylglycerol kinase family lipid kinase [Chitinophagales bacterium]|nr:diacylglycerol kinase family lipid kinase [Chitinophagales bacterium]HRN94098.1 diacylglycerol kinase family lipid kinase [Chitinophagales bacterium]HRP39332.1 diacylglycerol kinase family lipid kinase [Chitinophagales bacterium]